MWTLLLYIIVVMAMLKATPNERTTKDLLVAAIWPLIAVAYIVIDITDP